MRHPIYIWGILYTYEVSYDMRHLVSRFGEFWWVPRGHLGFRVSDSTLSSMCRVGQNHIYTVYIRCFWQENHQIYGHIRCIYTVLANPKHVLCNLQVSPPCALPSKANSTCWKQAPSKATSTCWKHMPSKANTVPLSKVVWMLRQKAVQLFPAWPYAD